MPESEKTVYYSAFARLILILFAIYQLIQGLTAFISPSFVVSNFVLDQSTLDNNEKQQLIRMLQYCGGGFIFAGLVSCGCGISSQSALRNVFVVLLCLFSLCEAIFITIFQQRSSANSNNWIFGALDYIFAVALLGALVLLYFSQDDSRYNFFDLEQENEEKVQTLFESLEHLNNVEKVNKNARLVATFNEYFKIIDNPTAFRSILNFLSIGKSTNSHTVSTISRLEPSIHKFVQDNFREGKLTTTQLQQYQRLLVRLFKTTRSGWRGTPDLFLSLCRAWMKEIFESNDPFSTVIIPGTHNSGAYQLQHFRVASNQWYLKLASGVSLFFKPLDYFLGDWAICNAYSLYDQLVLGIRHFDLRVSFRNDTFFITHTFTCGTLESALYDIRRFFLEPNNSREILILQMERDWEHRGSFTADVADKMFDVVFQMLGDSIFIRPLKENTPTVQNSLVDENFTFGLIWQRKQNILLVSDLALSEPKGKEMETLKWSVSTHLRSIWLNTPSPTEAIRKLDNWILESQTERKKQESVKSLMCINYVLTPGGDEIKPAAFNYFFRVTKRPEKGSRSLRDFAKIMHLKFLKHISELPMDVLSDIHLVDVDFPDRTSFVLNLVILAKRKKQYIQQQQQKKNRNK